ncbi:MAG: phenyltransferase domain-containing protein [Desulfobacteraceae bacterium]|nr:phenyltransferase domain-containing protein [Desulfobacteraceae bacterium]MBC2756231.1 phenyltransferase domain-containing protein [Desulfobacteraceae bacterium]
MKLDIPIRKQEVSVDIDLVASSIVQLQKTNGEIPWSKDGKTDPWDHIEAAMGLCIGSYITEARQAYEWMVDNQLDDGSWYASYLNEKPLDRTRETNLSSYIAVGVFHYYLITKDIDFLEQMWGTVRAAIDFAVSLQAPTGEIYWAKSPELEVDHMALLTGSSSIFMSLKCALAIAKILNKKKFEWEASINTLGHAIKNGYHLFNIVKSRYSMDWFYPVLSGALTGKEARQCIDQYWKKFVVDGMGILCVSDQPWVTIAETSELVLALAAMGNYKLAEIVFNWVNERTFEDGSYWCGFTYPDMVIWPEDKITWTNGVVIMAADALYQLSPASHLFSHKFWESSEYALDLK